MGLFGSLGSALGTIGKYYTSPEGLQTLGAGLKDMSAGGSENMMAMQRMMLQRQQVAMKRQAQQQVMGLFGGQRSAPMADEGGFAASMPVPPRVSDMVTGAMMGDPSAPSLEQVTARPQPQVPQMSQGGEMPSLSDPRVQQVLLQAQQAGENIAPIIQMLQGAQPDIRFDNGMGYNAKDPTQAGKFHPSLDKGQEPLFDANGRVVGIRNMDGSVRAAAEMAGGVAGAQERARAPYTFQTMTGPDGSPIVVSNETAASLGSNGGVIARGPTPAKLSADKITGDARATAAMELPQANADVQSALSTIQLLKQNPELKHRVGLMSPLGAIPGSAGADFDVALDQLKGKLFLQAFNSLKGAGQITETEGQKATAALGRLNRSQSEQGFRSALDELEALFMKAQTRNTQKAGGAPAGAYSQPDLLAEARRRGLVR